MIIKPIKTAIVRSGKVSLGEFLDKHLESMAENSVLAITSKVVALCEGRTVPIGKYGWQELIERESDYYIPPELSKFGMTFTVTKSTLIPAAGIDESNGDGKHVLWPADPQASANRARKYLADRFGLKNAGVIITDSTARPLHYGTEGVTVAFSGFAPSNNYIGKPDLFGRPFKISISNVADGLSAAAVLVMGEGTEQTPLAMITEVPFVKFTGRDPSKEELKGFYLDHMEDDLFAPFLRNAPWRKGRGGKAN